MTSKNNKNYVEHLETGGDVELAASPKVLGAADEETARYLDPSVVIDDETNRRIKRKLDRRILPFIIVTYFCQTFDKGTLAFSSTMGIQTDNHLHGQQYALLGTILYIGIIIGELPVNRLIQRVRIAKFLGCLVILWGVIVCCHAACKTWSQLMAVRFFLGLFESGVQPALMTLTIMYYRRVEHPTIISYWYCQQGVQLMVAGLLAWGLLHIKEGPLKSWQALFLIVGGVTIIWGIILLIFLPDSPMKAKCFDDRTKTLILERLRVNEQSVQDRNFKWDQAREALKDPIVWLYLTLQLASFIIVGGLAVFSNIIVRGLGFSIYQTQLLNLAQGAWSILIYIASAWLSRVTNQTTFVMIGFMLVALAGTIVLDTVAVTKQNAPGMLIAFYLANCVIVSGNLLWSLVTRNVAGQTKKTVVLTLMFACFALGNIIGPQVFRAKDAPRYHNAFAGHIAIYAVFCVLALVTRFLFVRRNVVRNKEFESSELTDTQAVHRDAFADLTDLQNRRAFRYVY